MEDYLGQFDSVKEIHSWESGTHSEQSGETPTAALMAFPVRQRKEKTDKIQQSTPERKWTLF